jgi:hypothetical protein
MAKFAYLELSCDLVYKLLLNEDRIFSMLCNISHTTLLYPDSLSTILFIFTFEVNGYSNQSYYFSYNASPTQVTSGIVYDNPLIPFPIHRNVQDLASLSENIDFLVEQDFWTDFAVYFKDQLYLKDGYGNPILDEGGNKQPAIWEIKNIYCVVATAQAYTELKMNKWDNIGLKKRGA